MDRKLDLLARTRWSMHDTVENTIQICLQKPNVHNSTLLKNTYEVSKNCPSIAAPWVQHSCTNQENRIVTKLVLSYFVSYDTLNQR